MLATLLAALLTPLLPIGLSEEQPPNVLLIVSDDQGYGDVSSYGGDIPTPHIDSIATAGARFTQWYVTAPVCTPSRYSILTGRLPGRALGGLDRVGMILDPAHDQHGLRETEPTLAGLLRDRGYRTALIGKWHLGHGAPQSAPTAHGFDSFYGARGGCIDYFTHRYGFLPDWWQNDEPLVEEGYATDLLTAQAVQFIGARSSDEPFFLMLSYLAPHYGKSTLEDAGPAGPAGPAGKDARTLFTRAVGSGHVDPFSGQTFHLQNSLQAPPELLERCAHIEDLKRRYFTAMVASMDDGIGQVLAALEHAGLAHNTLVIFTSDHGSDQTVSSAGSNGQLRGAKHTLFEGGLRVPCVLRWPGRIEPGTVVDQVCSSLDFLPTLGALSGADTGGLTLDGIDLTSVWLEHDTLERDLFWNTTGRAYRRGPWKLVGQALFHLGRDPHESKDLAELEPERWQELAAAHAAARAALAK